MKFIDHINLYFGTDFSSTTEFVKDFKTGNLSDDYEDAEEALTHLLMFINAAGKRI